MWTATTDILPFSMDTDKLTDIDPADCFDPEEFG